MGKLNKSLYVCSLYKSGSHLLKNVLSLLGLERSEYDGPDVDIDIAEDEAKKGKWVSTVHSVPNADILEACEDGEVNIILHIRDPRDMFVSTLDWFDWRKELTCFDHINEYRRLLNDTYRGDFDLMANHMLIGTLSDWCGIQQFYDQFTTYDDLSNRKNVHITKYEDFMGCSPTLSGLVDYLDIKEKDEYVHRHICAEAKKMKSRTFNKGEVGRWRKEFDPWFYADFLKEYGEYIVTMGYEL